MSDVEKLPSKNYIDSGISKNLLTPCRRVGLSRTKKTPNNNLEISTSPIIASTSLTIRGSPNIAHRVDSTNTPKPCMILPSDKVSEVTPDKNIIEDSYQTTDNYRNTFKTPLKDKFPNCRRLGLFRTKTTPKDINNPSPQDLSVGNVKGVSGIVTKNAKRCLNLKLDKANHTIEKRTDIILQNCLEWEQNTIILNPSVGRNYGVTENPITSTDVNNQLGYKLSPKTTDLNLKPSLLNSNWPVDTEVDSPPKSPVFSKVSVLIHHPAVKNKINSSISDKQKDHLKVPIEGKDHLSEVLEQNDINVKSKKLKLDNVNLKRNETNRTKIVKNNMHIKTHANYSSAKESPKSSCNKSSKLTRFTTEDYLEEYSRNPHMFEDHSVIGGVKNSLINIDGSDSDDFQPLEILRTKKSNNKNCAEKRETKGYMAILCPLSENSGIGKATRDLNEESLFKVSGTSENLTVSLKRLSSKNVNDNGKTSGRNENNHLFTQGKTIVSKLTFQTDDSDEEIFTSSPESNLKKRDNLMQIILTIKNEIKQKEETLERLKQAQAYKKMHNTEELNQLTNRWLQGCKTSLKTLLTKMLQNGPMEIDILMKNLMIPDDIVNKLKLL